MYWRDCCSFAFILLKKARQFERKITSEKPERRLNLCHNGALSVLKKDCLWYLSSPFIPNINTDILNSDSLVLIALSARRMGFNQGHCLCSFIRSKTLAAMGEVQGKSVILLHRSVDEVTHVFT